MEVAVEEASRAGGARLPAEVDDARARRHVRRVRPEAAEAFNREVDSRHEDTAWASGCSSWYLDDTGRNATLWPDWTFRFRRETSRFNPAHYRLEREAAQAVGSTATRARTSSRFLARLMMTAWAGRIIITTPIF